MLPNQHRHRRRIFCWFWGRFLGCTSYAKAMEYRYHREIAEKVSAQGAAMQVIEYDRRPLSPPLEGYRVTAERPPRWRQLAVDISGGSAILEAGALQYLRGDISLEATSSKGNLLSRAISAAGSGEGLYKTLYRGSGSIYTEPTQKHLLLGQIEDDELIVDDGAFVAAAGNLSVGRHINQGLLNTLGSGEGHIQPKLSGSGLFCLQTPVHPDEFEVLDLRGETLKVDGNLVVAYTAGLQMTVERAASGLLGSARTGEGFIQVYRGTGFLWLAPTLPIQ